jgi:hypothetical protein
MVDTSEGGVECHLVVVRLPVVDLLAFHLCKLVVLVACIFVQNLSAFYAFCLLVV